jgi:hypothetical protein
MSIRLRRRRIVPVSRCLQGIRLALRSGCMRLPVKSTGTGRGDVGKAVRKYLDLRDDDTMVLLADGHFTHHAKVHESFPAASLRVTVTEIPACCFERRTLSSATVFASGS